VEWIAIPADDEQAKYVAQAILNALSDYPVVCEEDYSSLEWEEACETWASMSLRDRVEMCSKHNVSIFAARRDDIPEGIDTYLLTA
jgi:hypothetical protein